LNCRIRHHLRSLEESRVNDFHPGIAQQSGHDFAVGIGATMTLPCNVRIASNTSKFGFVFTRRGIAPDGCASWFLPHVVGNRQRASLVHRGYHSQRGSGPRSGSRPCALRSRRTS
jgi:1,4-dihydroxy-2-naphthoyl-CoA synthase